MSDTKLQTPDEGTQEQKPTAEQKPDKDIIEDPLPPNPSVPQTPSVDYQKKFSESTREGQVLAGKLANLETQLGMAIKAEPPTDAELRAEYPEWDELTSFEKRMATQNLTLHKQVVKATLLANQATTEAITEREFTDILRKKNPDGTFKYPGLRDREDDFRAYCNMPTHKGAPLETLANAFLFELGDKPNPTPQPKPEPRPTLERTSGGDTPKPMAEISDEDAAAIRKNDSKRYNELIKSGKIKVKN